jgi:hypothetical protein
MPWLLQDYSSVSIVTRLQAGYQTNRVSFFGDGKIFVSSHKIPHWQWNQTASHSTGTGVTDQDWTRPSVNQTSYFHLVPNLRMSGAILPLPPYALMAWRRTLCLTVVTVDYWDTLPLWSPSGERQSKPICNTMCLWMSVVIVTEILCWQYWFIGEVQNYWWLSIRNQKIMG